MAAGEVKGNTRAATRLARSQGAIGQTAAFLAARLSSRRSPSAGRPTKGASGFGPGEGVVDRFVDQLPGSTTGWGAGADLRGWGPWAVPWGEQVWVQLHLVVGVRVGVWR